MCAALPKKIAIWSQLRVKDFTFPGFQHSLGHLALTWNFCFNEKFMQQYQVSCYSSLYRTDTKSVQNELTAPNADYYDHVFLMKLNYI